jgi:hypothetical protein
MPRHIPVEGERADDGGPARALAVQRIAREQNRTMRSVMEEALRDATDTTRPICPEDPAVSEDPGDPSCPRSPGKPDPPRK